MNPSSDNDEMAPEGQDFEIHTLVSAYLEEQISDSQWEYLSQIPRDHEFWDEWQDILATEHAMMVGFEPVENVIALPPSNVTSLEEPATSASYPLVRLAFSMVAAAAILVGLAWLMKPPDPGSGDSDQATSAGSTEPLNVFASSLANCRWKTESDRIYPGENLIERNISMVSGAIKIHFLSGRIVIFSGETEATFRAGGENKVILDLRHGEIAVVGGDKDSPQDGGFFISTPMGLLEEIGTEFVVRVGDEQVSVAVESGRVDIKGKEEFTLKARQSALLDQDGITREDRAFNHSERKLFDLMPETIAGPANVIRYEQSSMGNDICSIMRPDSLLLVEERQNVLLKNDIRYNIDEPGTYAFYRQGEEYRPTDWKMPNTKPQGAGTRLDSYLVQFNPSVEQLEDIQVYGYIEFDRPIQGILTGGYRLEQRDQLFGLPSMRYWKKSWPHANLVRGLESTSLSGGVANIADVLTLSEDRKRLTLRLCASLRLDHIRVLLKSGSE